MMVQRVSDEQFHLDLAGFDLVIEGIEQLAKKLEDLKNDLDRMNQDLMFNWSGQGRDTYEKKYRLLDRQFTDIGEELRYINEVLYNASESYIKADTELAKALDGVSQRTVESVGVK